MLPLPNGCEQADINPEAALLFAKGDLTGALLIVRHRAKRRLKLAYMKVVTEWFFDDASNEVLDKASGIERIQNANDTTASQPNTQTQEATQTNSVRETTRDSGRQQSNRNAPPESPKPDKYASPLGGKGPLGKDSTPGNSLGTQTPRKAMAESTSNPNSYWPT